MINLTKLYRVGLLDICLGNYFMHRQSGKTSWCKNIQFLMQNLDSICFDQSK